MVGNITSLGVDTEEAAAVLRTCSIFSHLPRDTLRNAFQGFTLRRFASGTYVAESGSSSSGLFIVIRGVATATPNDLWRQQALLHPSLFEDNASSSHASLPASASFPSEGCNSSLPPTLNPSSNGNALTATTVLGLDRASPLGISLDDDLGSAAAVAQTAKEPRSDESPSQPNLCQPYSLRPGDWFGHPPSSFPPPTCLADVTAATDLLCALFPQINGAISNSSNSSSSISSTDDEVGSSELTRHSRRDIAPPRPIRLVPSAGALNRLLEGKLEEILDLQTLTDQQDSFQGVSPPEMFEYPRIFGGQLVGQALMAATRTVDSSLLVHSLHCYFIRPGHNGHPVVYRVERIRDGSAFSARRVKAYQGSREIFLFTASFHRPEPGHSFRVQLPHGIPPPEALPMVEEEEWRLRTTPALPMVMRRRLARHPVKPLPADLRHCESVEKLACAQILREYPHPGKRSDSSGKEALGETGAGFSQVKDGTHADMGSSVMKSLNVWMKARGLSPSSEDLRLHRCIIGYLSDFVLLGTSLVPHGLFPANPRRFNMASLDHAMWFHEECRADKWLLYSMSSEWSGHARGLSLGRLFTREGVLAVSTAQEGLIRPLPAQSTSVSRL